MWWESSAQPVCQDRFQSLSRSKCSSSPSEVSTDTHLGCWKAFDGRILQRYVLLLSKNLWHHSQYFKTFQVMLFCKVSVIQLCLALHHAFLITHIIACTSVTLIVTGIYTPHVCYDRQTKRDSRNFHTDFAKPLIPSPILSSVYTLTSMCLPFWTTEQQWYPNSCTTSTWAKCDCT